MEKKILVYDYIIAQIISFTARYYKSGSSRII